MVVPGSILDSAHNHGILESGERAGVEIGVHIANILAKKLAPIFHDLYHCIMRIEQRQDLLEENLRRIYELSAAQNRKTLYLAFVPIAGGIAGASVDAVGDVLNTIASKGIELSDTRGMAAALLDVGDSILSSDKKLGADLGNLQSLQFRLSDEFINKMPEKWQVSFMEAIKNSGCELDRIREELDNLVKKRVQKL